MMKMEVRKSVLVRNAERRRTGNRYSVAVDGKSCGLRVTEAWQTTKPDKGGGGEGCTNGHPPPTPRRHTVTVGGMDLEYTPQNKHFDRQREAFLSHLAQKYPDHATVIKSKDGPLYGRLGNPKTKTGAQPDKEVTPSPAPGGPVQKGSEVFTDEGGGFVRGGTLRSSLPVVRSPNKTLEKPLGLVYLIFRNETKRALLPNEITTMDTVRALFVRSFPDVLSMAYLDEPTRKIYVMDSHTHLYYELEDFRDVKDRCVLKIYETGDNPSALVGPPNGVSRSPSMSPKMGHAPRCGYSGSESDTSVRSAPVAPHSPVHHRPYVNPDFSSKTQSLPVQPNYVYQQQLAQYASAAFPDGNYPPPTVQQFTSSPPHHPVQYRPQPNSNQGSPVRSSHGFAQQRHSVAYLPEANPGFPSNSLPQSRSYHDYYDGSRSGSATPTTDEVETRNRMMKMEAQLANLTALVQTAVIRPHDGSGGGSRPGSARSDASLASDNSAKSSSQSDTETHNRSHFKPIECASRTIELIPESPSRSGSTTPVVSPSSSGQTGLSDLSSATPQPVVSLALQSSLQELQREARQLRDDCRGIRRMQVALAETMRETINDTVRRIKEVIPGIPGADELPIRAQRMANDLQVQEYKAEAGLIERDLKDLEASVDELRGDVLNKRCRVNMSEVEVMALALSNVSKKLAELKGNFPQLQNEMKSVMAGEIQVVVKEEQYIREEPQRLDDALKRCKKLTGTLFTLKRLANVQNQHPPAPICVTTSTEEASEHKQAILQDIIAMAPDHKARLDSLQAAEESRERKKKLVVNQDALRFEKSLELAQKQIKERAAAASDSSPPKTDAGEATKENDDSSPQPETKVKTVEITLKNPSVNADTQKSPSPGQDQPQQEESKDGSQAPESPENGSVADKILALESPPKPGSNSGQGQQGSDGLEVTAEGGKVGEDCNAPGEAPKKLVSQSSSNEELVVTKAVVQSPAGQQLQSPPQNKVSVPAGPVRAPPQQKEDSGAPPKPPRAADREVEHVDGTLKYQAAVISVKSIGPSAQGAPAKDGAGDPGSHFSTFTKASTMPRSPDPQHAGQMSPTKLPPPTSTSTPLPVKNHVTFSNTVTEIIDSTPASWLVREEGSGKKKVPPPPPPRRSSRPTGQPSDGRPFSPPAYENIENFPAANDNDNKNPSQKLPQLRPPPNGFGGRREMDRTKHYSMNLYQMQMAEGIYANMGEIREIISDSDSTTSSDSRAGQARKLRPDSYPAADRNGTKDTVVLREGKKVPPPPPVRRTSALSNVPATIKEDENKNSPLANGEVKNEIITTTDSVQEIVTRFNTATANPKTVNGRTVNKKYEETEIY